MNSRWDDFLDYPHHWSPRASHRKRKLPDRPQARTLGEARGRHIWIWMSCAKRKCTMLLAVPLAPLIIRWGPDMLMDDVRRRSRCTRCGNLGMNIREPSWEAGDRRCVKEMHRWTGGSNGGPRFGVPEMK